MSHIDIKFRKTKLKLNMDLDLKDLQNLETVFTHNKNISSPLRPTAFEF